MSSGVARFWWQDVSDVDRLILWEIWAVCAKHLLPTCIDWRSKVYLNPATAYAQQSGFSLPKAWGGLCVATEPEFSMHIKSGQIQNSVEDSEQNNCWNQRCLCMSLMLSYILRMPMGHDSNGPWFSCISELHCCMSLLVVNFLFSQYVLDSSEQCDSCYFEVLVNYFKFPLLRFEFVFMT